jgi:hypothetical protein
VLALERRTAHHWRIRKRKTELSTPQPTAPSEGARRISQKRAKTREMVTADGKYSLVIFIYFMRGRHLYFMHIVRLKVERIKL